MECTGSFPRLHDATAAIRHMTNAATNTMARPSWNGPEMSCGKNCVPGERAPPAPRAQARQDVPGPSSFWIGL